MKRCSSALRAVASALTILVADFSHAVERRKLLARKTKKVRCFMHQIAVNQLLHQFVAQALNVQCTPLRKMAACLYVALADHAAGKARNGFTPGPLDHRVAFGQLRGSSN